MPKPVNQPPVVNAGADQTITLPSIASLNGSASDDGLPRNKQLTQKWEKVSGPGSVTFVDPTKAKTNASFTTAGSYILRLIAMDGQLCTADRVTIDVLPAASIPTTAPELPRFQVDITYSQPTGNTFHPHDSFQLQTALNSSLPGDLIIADAGANYLGSFFLPKKAAGAPIYIITSALTSLPGQGQRVGLSNAAAMARIIAPDPTSPAIYTQPSAHDFRFVGIDFRSEAGEANNGLVRLGTGGETSPADFPERIILDRCIVRGDPTQGGKRGLMLAGNFLAIINSTLSDWKLMGQDAQAIAGWTGFGPWRIENNTIEGAGENLLIGGSDPAIPNLVPSDIEIRSNLFSKPMAWNPYAPGYDGSLWQVKNALELKNARRVLIDGNRFENNWLAAQSGSMILFTPKNQDGNAPWTTVEDITFIRNRIVGTLRGIAIAGSDGGWPSAGGRRMLIKNNYTSDLGGALWGEGAAPAYAPSAMYLLVGGVEDLEINHNTTIHNASFLFPGAFIIADGDAYVRFKLLNSIWENNAYGIKGGGTGEGNPTLALYFPGADVRRNVMIGANDASYPADNFFPAVVGDVGFVNYPNDVRLGPSSSYLNDGTDGLNPGAADSVLV